MLRRIFRWLMAFFPVRYVHRLHCVQSCLILFEQTNRRRKEPQVAQADAAPSGPPHTRVGLMAGVIRRTIFRSFFLGLFLLS